MGKGIAEADLESSELALDEFLEEIVDGFFDQPDLSSYFHNSQIIGKASDDPTELIFCNTGNTNNTGYSFKSNKNNKHNYS